MRIGILILAFMIVLGIAACILLDSLPRHVQDIEAIDPPSFIDRIFVADSGESSEHICVVLRLAALWEENNVTSQITQALSDTFVLKVDGSEVERASPWGVADSAETTNPERMGEIYYCFVAGVYAQGWHNVRVELQSVSGATFTHSWRFLAS